MKWALTLAAIVLVTACSDGTEQAQEVLRARLAEKRYVDYQDLQAFPNEVVCGEFSTTDPMRGSTGFRRFVVWGQQAEDRPSEEDWAIFCTDDQHSALMTTFGIDSQDPRLPAIRADIATLELALQQYEQDNHLLPSTEQGLAALLAPSSVSPVPARFRAGGYIDQLPSDPWGGPYQYERSGLGGVAHNYRIYTLGADGAAGGSGEAADVGSDHLKYLDQIAPLK